MIYLDRYFNLLDGGCENKIMIVGTMLGLSGCSTKVMTYDVTGNMIGWYKAIQGLCFGARAVCYGNSNYQGIN